MIYSAKIRIFIISIFLMSIFPSSIYSIALDDEITFSQYEIRVIRPKFFIKRSKIELGANLSFIMNNSFVYTALVGAEAAYHFNESFGLGLEGSVGYSFDKEDKTTLLETFDIKTDIVRTFFTAQASLLDTPAYGKLQLPKGRLIYFDTFLSAGGGMTGISWKYSDFCQSKNNKSANKTIKKDSVGAYPGFVAGLGQRIFYSKTDALRWDLKLNMFMYSNQDSYCYEEGSDSVEGSTTFSNVLLQLGWSRFI